MSWPNDRLQFAVAVLLYGVSMLYSVFLWRRGFRQDNRINYIIVLAAFIPHTLALVSRGFSLARCPVHNLYEATVFTLWTMVITYLALGAWSRLRFLGAFASPVLFAIGVFALMPGLDVHGPKPQFSGGLLSLHITLSMLAYGAFGLGAVAGVMYLTQEHDLRFHKLRAVFSLMPSIERLEKVMSRLLLAGFILLTAGLALGAVYFKESDGFFLTGDPKIVWSIVVWVLYFTLILMRWKFSQSGRRLAWGVVCGFVFVSLTFWGSSLMSPIHNPAPAPGAVANPARPS